MCAYFSWLPPVLLPGAAIHACQSMHPPPRAALAGAPTLSNQLAGVFACCLPCGLCCQVPLSTPSVLRQLEALESGGAVALLDEEAAQQLGLATDEAGSGALTANAPLAVSVWRTRASLSVLVAKNECEQMADKVRQAQQQQQQQGSKGKAAAVKQTEAAAA
eukprot:GHRQ01036824.1.p1 GENE.GHRQ01036824.1~~GHRQ01036824.1.p1  ORF type:complete len:162 (-),score=59.97 GHRQ01036824.1:9-494(-)